MGNSFGVSPTMEKEYMKGAMKTKVDDCQVACPSHATKHVRYTAVRRRLFAANVLTRASHKGTPGGLDVDDCDALGVELMSRL